MVSNAEQSLVDAVGGNHGANVREFGRWASKDIIKIDSKFQMLVFVL
jgi:hypothetical protein